MSSMSPAGDGLGGITGMKLYLYAKQTERLDAFDCVLDTLRLPVRDLRYSSEHERAWHVLDDTIGHMICGDGLCVTGLESLGGTPDDMALRMGGVIMKDCLIVVASVPATYEFGLEPVLNKAVASAVIQGLQAGRDNKPFIRQPGAGRPRLDFPEGWAELYERWEKGGISSKAFLEASGLKKATFYNKLADYRELREFNIRYLLEHGIA